MFIHNNKTTDLLAKLFPNIASILPYILEDESDQEVLNGLRNLAKNSPGLIVNTEEIIRELNSVLVTNDKIFIQFVNFHLLGRADKGYEYAENFIKQLIEAFKQFND